MQATSQRNQQGMSLLEIVISVAIAGMLMAGISSAISGAIEAQRNTRAQNEALQQTRFALNRMVTAVSKTRYLMIPLAENPATAWAESQRDVLAVTLDPTLDRDQDGWADANNDKDFLDVNNNGTRNVGEPERIDEDTSTDNTNDGKPGIIGIDDDNDGVVDEGNSNNNDEDAMDFEDPINGIDDDNDGSIDEDYKNDMNNDNATGVMGVDDDMDGSIDEGGVGAKGNDDEDNLQDEDWLDPVVYYLNGTTLMERMPAINPVSGADFSAYPIADNVSQFLVQRSLGGNGRTVLVSITLTLSPPDNEPVTLETTIAVGSGL